MQKEGKQDGSLGKGACYSAWCPEFAPYHLCKGGRRERTPEDCPLMSATLCDTHETTNILHTNNQYNNNTVHTRRDAVHLLSQDLKTTARGPWLRPSVGCLPNETDLKMKRGWGDE